MAERGVVDGLYSCIGVLFALLWVDVAVPHGNVWDWCCADSVHCVSPILLHTHFSPSSARPNEPLLSQPSVLVESCYCGLARLEMNKPPLHRSCLQNRHPCLPCHRRNHPASWIISTARPNSIYSVNLPLPTVPDVEYFHHSHAGVGDSLARCGRCHSDLCGETLEMDPCNEPQSMGLHSLSCIKTP